MAKKMLIDATQAEETRVAVINGNRLDELDFEIASRQQLKGNIYLAKVTRVEPSLQAAFIEYGGNRHGFLAFAEIHPDYYKIPVADREKLLELEREEAEREAAEEEAELAAQALAEQQAEALTVEDGITPVEEVAITDLEAVEPGSSAAPIPEAAIAIEQVSVISTEIVPETEEGEGEAAAAAEGSEGEEAAPAPGAEEGDDDMDRRKRARRRANILRQYKIQEVIKKNQIMLIQVVKEERGNKGAALTTYLSLAGRYCVLMPNTNRGGGVSRKISSLEERRRMKQLLAELDMPQGMSIILRTAGLERSKADIKRDLEYLTRLWDSIRDKTLSSTAPTLVHEEANLIRRAIRDLYSREVSEVQVEGDVGYRTAKDFMRMMVPSAARRVHHYRDPAVPLFVRHRIESQIESLYSTTVGLRSGGYIVINQTEALVAIDVNSGRATRERNIEETALRTNLEAADEVARQLRLRDLAGLIVIDFIDMEDNRHNLQVERRMREAMKNDRARIQIGRISMFGLLELSRQRLRPSLIESNFSPCTACGGIGHVRSIESAALHVLRSIEEEGLQQKASELAVTVAEPVALYLLNHKRAALGDIERRYGIKVFVHSDTEIIKNAEHKIERLKLRQPGEFQFPEPPTPVIDPEDLLIEETEEDKFIEDSADGEAGNGELNSTPTEDGEERGYARNRGRGRGRDRNRRGRGRDRGDRPAQDVSAPGAPQPDVPLLDENGNEIQPADLPSPEDQQNYVALTGHGAANDPAQGDSDGRRRRRGRRGGRGRFRDRDDRSPQDGFAGDPAAIANGNVADGFDGQPQPEMATAEAGEAPAQGEAREGRHRGGRGRGGGSRGPREGGRDGNRGRGRGEYGDRPPREPREPRLQDAPPGGSSGGGIKIISEFRGRNDPPSIHTSQPVAAPAPSVAASAPPVGSDSNPSPDKPRTGWWKRLMG